jgi:hypothetical protein
LCKLEVAKKYYTTFINDCTKYCYAYLFKGKDKTPELFKQYNNEVENQFNKKIKGVRSDRGRKYKTPFDKLCF